MARQTIARDARHAQRGMLVIGVLALIALSALTAVQAGPRWIDARQRANEEELLFVGEQYRLAIESYWRETPNAIHKMPTSIDDLILDKRFPFPKRHLRKEFRDPLAPEQGLAEIRDGGALIGVYSKAEGTPYRQAGLTGVQKSFNGAQRYADWKFSYVPPAAPAVGAPPPTGKTPGARR